jgi:FkbM family methyltransferase
MEKKIKHCLNKILKIFNLKLLKYSTFLELTKFQKKFFDIRILQFMNKKNILNNQKYVDLSKSQLRQDIFVLNQLNFKKKGYFVEFGAANGKFLSNTYLLEKEFKWSGILVEPSKIFHEELFNNRNCVIDKRAVWKKSGSKLLFAENSFPELSTLKKFINSDSHVRSSNNEYEINTISLNDLLIEYNAPKQIDYLSIDTEGSEYDILYNFDFKNYQFRVITCEHNYTKNRELIKKLLVKNGYLRKFTEISEYDDWYINPSLV